MITELKYIDRVVALCPSKKKKQSLCIVACLVGFHLGFLQVEPAFAHVPEDALDDVLQRGRPRVAKVHGHLVARLGRVIK